jgi:phosphoribosylformylglycinamidine cyclo-ligase
VDYRLAGVDIEAGDEAVRRIKALARATYTPGVLSGVGSFGGLFALDGQLPDPVLVASADGVGTKLKVAFLAGVHDTVGTDLVNHCVNDILVQGACPLFFLDYLSTAALDPLVAEQIVSGMARACRANQCALLGGETAEMPGFYAPGEYDLAGFIVGIVSRAHVIDGGRVQQGDALVALPSDGLHTNGYSLARAITFERLGLDVSSYVPELGQTLAEALLRPHRSYLGAVKGLLGSGRVRGMAHITGGGIPGNLPRTLPRNLSFRLDRESWTVPSLFAWLQRSGSVSDEEMFRTFNMGVGLILICAPVDVSVVMQELKACGEEPWVVGEVV